MGEFELSNEAFERLRGVVHRLTGIALSDAKRSLIHGPVVAPAAGSGD